MRPDLLIRDARRAAGLTQSQLAARLGVSQSAIAKLEREGSNPTVGTLDRTLRATGHRLQLIAPAWGSIDTSLIRQALQRRTPAERIKSVERMHNDMRRLQIAAVRSRERAAQT
jgi:transcriptional regulator with XRE-family HTH domain